MLPKPPSAILLEDNKVFIAHSYMVVIIIRHLRNHKWYGMTPTTTQLSTVQYSCTMLLQLSYLKPIKYLLHIHMAVTDIYTAPIVTINDTTMTPTTQLSTVQNSCHDAPSAILLELNKVFIASHILLVQLLYGGPS